MKLRKIIIGLSAVGLIGLLANNIFADGDEKEQSSTTKPGAAPAVTVAFTYYVCNNTTQTINVDTFTDPNSSVKVVRDDPIDFLPNTCHTVTARAIADKTNLPTVFVNAAPVGADGRPITAATTTVKFGNTRIIGLGGNYDVTKQADVLEYTEPQGAPTLIGYLNINGSDKALPFAQIVNKAIDNLSGGVSPDGVICIGGTTAQCNDSSHLR